MVALLILVQLVKVRILMGQQETIQISWVVFLFLIFFMIVKGPCLRDAVRQGILMGQQGVSLPMY